MSEVINKRREFVVLFDVENGNPNGDPDAGNLPRIDFETGHGIITDVCIKRKIRNYVGTVKEGCDGFDIYVKEGTALNSQHKKAYDAMGLTSVSKKLPKSKTDAEKLTAFMCSKFYDIRAFGAVMSTDVNCGQVRGPIQMTFARSADPIFQQEITITRVAVTKEDADKDREMGRKAVIPYGLYRMEGYVSANLAMKSTHFSEQDLDLFWEALINMFEHDRSASRGKMTTRKLFVFEHETALGNCQAHTLFDRIVIKKNVEGVTRKFSDYSVSVDKEDMPSTVKLLEKL
ncbi:MAG: type I-C CRISPR-associated protein Cas7/Csd2 [Methanomassiliicoccales archaeon]|nr:type I-C CRISPR-associated protein Cas7/Csd2 [Methanomassiliicoccales archaeon]